MAINEEIFLGSGATLTLVPETDLYIRILHTQTGAGYDSGTVKTKLKVHSDFSGEYLLVNNLYVGCVLDLYDGAGTTTPVSSHTIIANDSDEITVSPAYGIDLADNDFAVIRGYAAPCVGAKNSTVKRLNADNWLGLVESATFPNVEVEMKQLNLQLGGTRSFTHQYKGIKTASGASINLASNHGAFLYYALGHCSTINATFEAVTVASEVNAETGPSGDDSRRVYLDTSAGGAETADITDAEFIGTGPIFYKTERGGTAFTPPILEHLNPVDQLELLDRTTTTATALSKAIKYTFTEGNTAVLPSFALEQSISKLESSNTFITGDTSLATESHTFTRIARGNRVNTLTMTANENEELKMTLDLNTAGVHKLATDESYEARGGITDNTQLFNFEQAADEAEFLEPFFFSKGAFNIFGQEFLKITNLTLTINNNIQDKRFIGISTKDLKVGIPAQRNYELSFTALVTDNKLFEELFNETESTSTSDVTDGSSNGVIILEFLKNNQEKILLKFKNYHIGSANVTVPDDRGPITVEATVMPRDLHLCEVTTHWVLQG
tara:strand:+ start:59 stop:1720 length:1662 start_codon:yes stop_codon:yes gene_type:complete